MKMQVALVLVTCLVLVMGKSTNTWSKKGEQEEDGMFQRMRRLFLTKRREDRSERKPAADRTSGADREGGRTGTSRIQGTTLSECTTLIGSGTLLSQNNPNNYPNRHDSCWILQAAEGQYPSVTFVTFNLESHSTCRWDYVEVYDGSAPNLPLQIGGRLCGNTVPQPITGKQQQMYFKFHTDSSVTRTGFQVTFASESSPGTHTSLCSEVAEAGTISSTNHPSNYPNNHYQCWLLFALPSETAELKFESFDLESHSSCRWDWVEIYNDFTGDVSSRIGSRRCGTQNPGTFTTSGSGFMVVFKSDYSVTRYGFQATFAPQQIIEPEVTTIEPPVPPPSGPVDCGVPEVLSSVIVGGEEADPHAWPWQISLRYFYSGSFRHICGGSIVAEQWVITAAHCVDGGSPNQYQVTIGEHNRNVAEGPEQNIGVTQVIVHNEYNTPTWNDHDIALLKLATPITFSQTAKPVCLPNLSVSDPAAGTDCYTTGWGETNTAQGSTGDNTKLLQVQIPIVDRGVCNGWMGISENMICAGYAAGQQGACRGDSGGPLVCRLETNGPWYLFGLTSWGRIPCGGVEEPTVFARVTQFKQWIIDNSASEITLD